MHKLQGPQLAVDQLSVLIQKSHPESPKKVATTVLTEAMCLSYRSTTAHCEDDSEGWEDCWRLRLQLQTRGVCQHVARVVQRGCQLFRLKDGLAWMPDYSMLAEVEPAETKLRDKSPRRKSLLSVIKQLQWTVRKPVLPHSSTNKQLHNLIERISKRSIPAVRALWWAVPPPRVPRVDKAAACPPCDIGGRMIRQNTNTTRARSTRRSRGRVFLAAKRPRRSAPGRLARASRGRGSGLGSGRVEAALGDSAHRFAEDENHPKMQDSSARIPMTRSRSLCCHAEELRSPCLQAQNDPAQHGDSPYSAESATGCVL